MKTLFIYFSVLLICLSGKSQIMTTIAGTGNTPDSGDSGLAIMANIYEPTDITLDTKGNVFISEHYSPGIRKINRNNIISTPIQLSSGVQTIAVDSIGYIYAGWGIVERISKSGVKTIICGSGTNTNANGILATQAILFGTQGIILDRAGYIYIADLFRIMKIDSLGYISTIAGTYGVYGYSGDNGLATDALFYGISAINFDKKGNLYIADESNNVIRKIDTAGIITTIAGTGVAGFSGDNGLAINAKMIQPSGIAIDNFGNLYISDQANNRIRKVDTTGIITTYAGSGKFGSVDGPSLQATMNYLAGLFIDSINNLYIADYGNNRIRKVDTAGIAT